jgi:hypothetical protein
MGLELGAAEEVPERRQTVLAAEPAQKASVVHVHSSL